MALFIHKIFQIRWKVIKNLDPRIIYVFWKHERLAVGLWRYCLCLVCIMCTLALVWKCSSLFVMKFISKNIDSRGRLKICSLWNRPLQELWDMTPTISLIIFFCNVDTFLLSDGLPLKIIPYFIKEWKETKLINLRVSVLLICNIDLTA
jgi:hypothetical protein